MQRIQFDGLAEFREVIPQLATASSHPVYVDVGEAFGAEGSEPTDPQKVNRQAIWNGRDDRLAYTGSDGYEITQHSEVLQYIDDAVGQTVGEIDIGFVRDYGERIDGMCVLEGHSVDVGELVGEGYVPPESQLLDDRTASVEDAKNADGTVRDILGVGIRFQNSFDGSERIRLETMGYRFICQNWMIWGKETIGKKEMLHLERLDREVVEELIFDVMDKQDDMEMIVLSATEQELKMEEVPGILDNVGFGKQYQRNILRKLIDEYGRDHDGELTRWDVYNAITDHLDNDIVDTVNPNVYDRHQDKAVKLLMNEVKSPDETIQAEELIEIEA